MKKLSEDLIRRKRKDKHAKHDAEQREENKKNKYKQDYLLEDEDNAEDNLS